MNNEYIKNLWKVATAYLVGSFALIQFANIAFPYFAVEEYLGLSSDQIMKGLFIGLPIGLPLILTGFYFLKKSGFIDNNNSLEIEMQSHSGSYKQKIAVIPFTNLNNAIFKNSKICGPTSYIDQCDTCLFFLLTQYRF